MAAAASRFGSNYAHLGVGILVLASENGATLNDVARYGAYSARLKGCAVCRAEGSAAAPLARCSGCHQALYCGRAHQREHWAAPSGGHKGECRALAAAGWATDLEAAAKTGHVGMQEAVALKLMAGRAGVVQQDLAEAAKWFRRAVAPRANETESDRTMRAQAQYNFGVMLSQGLVPGTAGREALREAHAQWREAAAAHHAGACYNLANHHRRVGELPQAEALYRTAAAAGLAEAQNALGEMLAPLEAAAAQGRDVQEPAFDAQWRAALPWWRRAAEQGNADAMYRVGTAYLCATGVEYDIDAGRSWLLRAAAAAGSPVPEHIAMALESLELQAGDEAAGSR